MRTGMKLLFARYHQSNRSNKYVVWGALACMLVIVLGLWVFVSLFKDRVTADDVETILGQLEKTHRQFAHLPLMVGSIPSS